MPITYWQILSRRTESAAIGNLYRRIASAHRPTYIIMIKDVATILFWSPLFSGTQPFPLNYPSLPREDGFLVVFLCE